MDLVSAVSPTIAPFFGELAAPQAPAAQEQALPANFWALLLSPMDGESFTEVPVGPEAVAPLPELVPIKVASPKQIAQAVIRSMLTPVDVPLFVTEPTGLVVIAAIAEQSDRAPKPEATPEGEIPTEETHKQDSPEIPALPVTIAAPQQLPVPMIRIEQPVREAAARSRFVSTTPSLPEVVAAAKTTTPAPIAFELRLTSADGAPNEHSQPQEQPEPQQGAPVSVAKEPPKTAASAPMEPDLSMAQDVKETPKPVEPPPIEQHPRPQRDEPAVPGRKTRETMAPAQPFSISKTVPVVSEVLTHTPPHEPQAPPKLSVPEALAAPDPIEAAKPESASGPVREIAMRVSAPDSKPVDVRISERRGEVHVAVRTADSGLKTSLQGDLGSLVGKLEQSGFRAEAAIPEPTFHISEQNVAAHSLTTHAIADLGGSATYSDSQDSRGESNGRGANSDTRHSNERQQQQQQHRRATRAWEQLMEDMQ